MPASDWSILCEAVQIDRPGHGFFSIVCGADGGIFVPIFSDYRKEMAAMTMPKREVNSIWSKVREDRDIDDLIFNYDACHTSEDDADSDR